MTNHAAGKDILEYARQSVLGEMTRARAAGVHPRVVRLAQEALELALKAAIRELSADYPMVHDPAAAFVAVALGAGVALSSAEVRRLLEESKWLADNRGPAGYLERPYVEEEAARAADAAAWVFALVEDRVFSSSPPCGPTKQTGP
jgi:HEPN domain-containing protein